ncbi:MAG: DUF3291 domain-containing protein [Pseudomonadota bacterium]
MFELAQMNVATMRAPLESPELADFVAGLERINALAEAADGFVWRLQTDDGDATALRPLGDDVLINISVWRDIESLKTFVYQTTHVDFLRRRAEWFANPRGAHAVLWWVPAGHRPTEQEGIDKLDYLNDHGPTAAAFSFASPFPASDSPPR